MLWIHAGPHKAASSYVTERLRQNRDHLAAQGVLMDGDNNRLANAIAEKKFGPVEEDLATLPLLKWITNIIMLAFHIQLGLQGYTRIFTFSPAYPFLCI